MDRLPLEVQTLYAELLAELTALDAARSVGSVPGCFVTKPGRDGGEYVYFQYMSPGSVRRQVYLGRRDADLDSLIERHARERENWKSDTETARRLCAQLRVGGGLVTDSPTARVLRALAESGVFRVGGTLVGTHAFTVIGNLLGVRWERGGLRTQDIDSAVESSVSVAVPDLVADVPGAPASLGMGFLPVPPLDPRSPSTPFKVRGKTLRVDLVTPSGDAGGPPVSVPRLGAAAQPLPGLAYLLEDTTAGAVVDGDGVLVRVPSPARFAFHKLATAQGRAVSEQVKAEKDRLQAGQVFSVLAEDRPGDLALAWDALGARDALRKAVRRGLDRLLRDAPGLGALLDAEAPHILES